MRFALLVPIFLILFAVSAQAAALSGQQELAERLTQIQVPLPRLSPLPVQQALRMSLDGTWNFNPVAPLDPGRISADDASKWRRIQVPGEWVMQGFKVATNASAVYCREFKLPHRWRGERVKVRFDTVQSIARVWVNGRAVGEHEGGFLPFELDITDAIQTGKNTMVVAVTSESLSDDLSSATRYAGHQLGGITRKVTLFAVPEVNLAALALRTEFDKSYRDATLNLHLEIANESALPQTNVSLDFQLAPPPGDLIERRPFHFVLPEIGAHAVLSRDFAIPVASPMKWDTEHPNLYTLTGSLNGRGHGEIISQRFGFRQVEVRGNQVFVNGQPIKLHGVCRHETHPLLGRSLNPKLWREDAEIFRAANINYIRTSHYPPPEEFLSACDELGIFVECEAPLCWVQQIAGTGERKLSGLSPKLFPYLMRVNQENIVFNRNHPSIIIWSLANESRWTPLFAEVNKRVKALDPSRPTSFHDQCWGDYNNAGSQADIAVYHYPDTNGPARCDEDSRPTLFGEYCHVQTYNRREGFTDPGIRDQWGPRFAEMYDLMYRHPGCLGGAIWSGIDDVFYLPDGEVEGYGFWGIIDGWRRAKPELFHVRKAYSPIRVTTTNLPAGPASFKIALENRYTFSNLREVGIRWQIGSQHGSVNGDIAPRSAGTIEIKLARIPAAGDALRLSFTDPRGFVCEAVELPVGIPRRRLLPPGPLALGALTVETNGAILTVKGKSFSCEIEQGSGQIRDVSIGKQKVLVGGPAPMILPLECEPCAPADLRQFGAFNALCQNWRARSVTAATNDAGDVLVNVEGEADEATGQYTLRFSPDGRLNVDYSFRVKKAVNPRQAGMVFFLPRAYDTLRWERHAEWSAYPADHIGRPLGEAKANPNAITHYSHLTAAPGTSWAQDANFLGTADFRSTKSHLIAASLENAGGRGIFLQSDGAQSARAFVDGDRIGWLVASINAGGGETFFSVHHAPDRRPLKPGDVVEDSIDLQLIAR